MDTTGRSGDRVTTVGGGAVRTALVGPMVWLKRQPAPSRQLPLTKKVHCGRESAGGAAEGATAGGGTEGGCRAGDPGGGGGSDSPEDG